MSELGLRDRTWVSAEQVEEFSRNGAIRIRGLLDSRWLEQLAQGFPSLAAAAHDLSNYYDDHERARTGAVTGHGVSLSRGENWRLSAEMRDYIFNSPIGALAAAVIQSQEVRLYEDLLIYRSAGSARPTPWHQDSPQNPLVGWRQCSVWMSLDPTSSETGGMRFIAGSHRGPTYIPYVPAEQRERVERDMRFFDGGPLPDFESDPDRFKVISFDTEPGDVIVFHPNTVHGAFGSAASHPRRTLSVRFIGDDVRWQPKESVFHDWLRAIDLEQGAPVRGECFPLVWPPSQ